MVLKRAVVRQLLHLMMRRCCSGGGAHWAHRWGRREDDGMVMRGRRGLRQHVVLLLLLLEEAELPCLGCGWHESAASLCVWMLLLLLGRMGRLLLLLLIFQQAVVLCRVVVLQVVIMLLLVLLLMLMLLLKYTRMVLLRLHGARGHAVAKGMMMLLVQMLHVMAGRRANGRAALQHLVNHLQAHGDEVLAAGGQGVLGDGEGDKIGLNIRWYEIVILTDTSDLH